MTEADPAAMFRADLGAISLAVPPLATTAATLWLGEACPVAVFTNDIANEADDASSFNEWLPFAFNASPRLSALQRRPFRFMLTACPITMHDTSSR